MSRFVHLLERNQKVFNVNEMCRMAGELLGELNSTKGQITVTFPFFLSKTAPRSRIKSFLDYEVNIKILVKNDGLNHKFERILAICVPVTSLCPCSKRISKYGAHNQRSMITISVQLDEKKVIPIEDLILIAEQQGSSELFGLLKREDEKAVTEKAYENAKFVEDIVRDVVLKIKDDERIVSYTVEVENFESIHNHSAYARIDG